MNQNQYRWGEQERQAQTGGDAERRRVRAGPHECGPVRTNTSRCHQPADMEDELRSSCRASSSLSISLRWTRDLRPWSCFRTDAGLEPAATLLARSSMTPGRRRGVFVCDDAGGGKRKTRVVLVIMQSYLSFGALIHLQASRPASYFQCTLQHHQHVWMGVWVQPLDYIAVIVECNHVSVSRRSTLFI